MPSKDLLDDGLRITTLAQTSQPKPTLSLSADLPTHMSSLAPPPTTAATATLDEHPQGLTTPVQDPRSKPEECVQVSVQNAQDKLEERSQVPAQNTQDKPEKHPQTSSFSARNTQVKPAEQADDLPEFELDEDVEVTSDEESDDEDEEQKEGQKDPANTSADGEVHLVQREAPKRYVKKMTEGRMKRVAEFSDWFKKVKDTGLKEEINHSQNSKYNDEKLSTKQLISSHTHSIIGTPRDYQLELYEVAKKQNTLAVLDTGSGKTLIACLLIRHTIAQELEARRKMQPRRVSFFLVDSVNLVFQQTAVLDCNIDAKVGKYCGDMCRDLWKKEAWTKILDAEDVIVMTADVLYNCLTHGFIKMTDINLICFDEAHHAKKDHVYARIIKDFYVPLPEDARPRIFGMTASPVDARVNVEDAASQLERLLHSKISTTTDTALMSYRGGVKIQERVCAYPALKKRAPSPLFQKLSELYRGVEAIKKVFLFAENANTELGPWLSDHAWMSALSDVIASKLERKAEKELNQQLTQAETERIEKEIAKIREVRELVATQEQPKPTKSMEHASPKVMALVDNLKRIFNEPTTDKCIVFVTRRWTARVLNDYLLEVGPPHMKLGFLIGSRNEIIGDQKFSFHKQMLVVSRFSRGVLNCLVATSVAEEGLDIPDCNVVIRFDQYKTMIQYIQSRGRARHVNSKYIHMLESGNSEHMRQLREVRDAEQLMRKFCESLPEDRLLDRDALGNPQSFVDDEDKVYIEESTQAKLTLNSAMQVIAHYCGHLREDGEGNSGAVGPTYYVTSHGINAFSYELILPSSSPLHSFEGPLMSNKAAAKRAAAFEACLQLRKAGYIDAYLRPEYRLKEVPTMANARLAVDAKKTSNYAYRPKPSFWNIDTGMEAPTQLWVTVMQLSHPEHMQEGRELQTISILTRQELPPMPSFPIYSDKGLKSELTLVRLTKALAVPLEHLEKLNEFTLRCFSDVFNKVFEFSYDTVRYWLVPMLPGIFTERSDPQECIDWKLIQEVKAQQHLVWNEDTPHELFKGRFLIDKIQRSRRFSTDNYYSDLKMDDPLPPGVASAPGMTSIKDYSYNAGKRGLKYKNVKWEIPKWEPVLAADRVLHRLSYLEPPHQRDTVQNTKAFIVPSPFNISLIPIRAVYSLMIFPAISTRVDAYLHAWDVCKLVGFEMSLGLALEAITKDSDNTYDPEAEQINKVRGMGANYERLEFLGDCFLKLATSISLYAQSHSDDEYKLHVQRMVLVCNQNLFERAKIMGLPAYIQTQGFSRRLWYPEMRLLHGKSVNKERVRGPQHRLGDKSIADVCEALIGAALLSGGLDGATHMVSVLLNSTDHRQKLWAEYYQTYKKPAYQLKEGSASQLKLVDDIEKQFGYRFKSPRLLMSAFVHSSNPFAFEKVPSYERLEFLGDALLDQACVRYIFDSSPHADPQWMTEHKMAMVSNKFLGAVAVILGFHPRLRRMGSQLDANIRDYAVEILEAREKDDKMNFWTHTSAPPKALSDVLEAFVGALFVDAEFDYGIVQRFFDDYIKPYFVDISLYDDFAGQHPTTFLTKELTKRGCEQWGYESDQLRNDEDSYIVVGVMLHLKVFAYGKGISQKAAKIEASENALKKLAQMPDEDFYQVCDCRVKRELERRKEEADAKNESFPGGESEERLAINT